MKKRILIVLMALVTLSACGSKSTPTPIPTVSLDSSNTPTNNNNQSSDGNTISASAVIVPLTNVSLSFSTIGRVTAVNARVGDKVTAGQVLVQLDTTILEAKVREAEANLLATQIQAQYLKRIGTEQVHLESAQADVARAQALLDSANATLIAQSNLVAPFDGTLVSVDIAPAETVVPGQIVIVLGDLSSYKIETTDLSERDVTRVKVGQSVAVFIEALNDNFTGRVADISRIGSTLGGDVVYKVIVELDKQPQGLLWGMSADVKIQAAQ